MLWQQLSPGPCLVPGALSPFPAPSPAGLQSQLSRSGSGKGRVLLGDALCPGTGAAGPSQPGRGVSAGPAAASWLRGAAELRISGLGVLLHWPGDFKGRFWPSREMLQYTSKPEPRGGGGGVSSELCHKLAGITLAKAFCCACPAVKQRRVPQLCWEMCLCSGPGWQGGEWRGFSLVGAFPPRGF